jgi:RND family efflux transporter MFP subunit
MTRTSPIRSPGFAGQLSLWLLPVALVAGLAAGCGPKTGGDQATAEAVRAFVKVSEAGPQSVERSLELTATVQAGRALDLVTDVPGKIRELPVKVGDEVREGALLARLDTDMAKYQFDQAEAASKLAALGAATAEREFGRATALHETSSMTEQQFEQARSGLEMAQLQRAQAEAMKSLAAKQVHGGVLTAPFSGVISAVCCEQGAYFNPMTISSMGGPRGMVSIVNLDTIKADLQVSENDVGRVQTGMPVHVIVDSVRTELGEDGLPGTVESVGLAADATSRTFPVRVIADNPGHVVKAGTHARIRLVLESKAGVLAVPLVAVRTDKDEPYVVSVESGKARRIPVKIGLEGNSYVEILSGLKGGEKVVVAGNFGLPDGASVEISD